MFHVKIFQIGYKKTPLRKNSVFPILIRSESKIKAIKMAARRKKEPVHRIFYVCSTFTPDKAWAEFLKECSFGKFPKGVRFENGAIKCNRKKQIFTEYLPKDTAQTLQLIIEIFRDRLGIKTVREKKSAAVKFNKCREEFKITTWKGATTIAAKNSLIRSFSDRFASYYILSASEHQELLLLLNLGISTKLITADHIHVDDGKISRIDGLNFDIFTRQITITAVLPKYEPDPVTIPLYYKPVSQMNYAVRYHDLLAHHIAKQTKAGKINNYPIAAAVE